MTDQELADEFRQACYAHYMGMLDLDETAIAMLATQCFAVPLPVDMIGPTTIKCISIKYAADEYRRRNKEIPSFVLTMLTVLEERDVRTS